jgi:predicted nucleotidyltransferase
MHRHEKETLQLISQRLKEKLQGKLVIFCVFGSKARGDHDEYSDFDVLVIVKDKTPELEDGIMDVFIEEELKSSIFFTPLIKDFQAFEKERRYNTPFYQNIEREGIML